MLPHRIPIFVNQAEAKDQNGAFRVIREPGEVV